MRQPESYEKEDITKFLKTLGPTCWWHKPFMKGFGKNGVPDIMGVLNATFFTIEVKRDTTTRPTPIQTRRMKEIKEAGGVPFCGPASVVIPAFRAHFNV